MVPSQSTAKIRSEASHPMTKPKMSSLQIIGVTNQQELHELLAVRIPQPERKREIKRRVFQRISQP